MVREQCSGEARNNQLRDFYKNVFGEVPEWLTVTEKKITNQTTKYCCNDLEAKDAVEHILTICNQANGKTTATSLSDIAIADSSFAPRIRHIHNATMAHLGEYLSSTGKDRSIFSTIETGHAAEELQRAVFDSISMLLPCSYVDLFLIKDDLESLPVAVLKRTLTIPQYLEIVRTLFLNTVNISGQKSGYSNHMLVKLLIDNVYHCTLLRTDKHAIKLEYELNLLPKRMGMFINSTSI